MNPEDQIRERFVELPFRDEPPMASQPEDDVLRGERGLRRGRFVIAAAAVTTAAAVAAAALVALPLRSNPSTQTKVADRGGGSQDKGSVTSVGPDNSKLTKVVGAVYAAGVEHLDPKRSHLKVILSRPAGVSYGKGGSAAFTGMNWVVPGENGLGYVGVEVTTPGFNSPDLVNNGFYDKVGCANLTKDCVQRTVNGKTVWVGERTSGRELAVFYRRPDGAWVAFGVFTQQDKFVAPVSKVDISLDDAIAFVTDRRLVFDPVDAAKYKPSRNEFPITKKVLHAAAVRHLDPGRAHLPEKITGHSGSSDFKNHNFDVGARVSWTNHGEQGEGVLSLGVTTPHYARNTPSVSWIGCDGAPRCRQQAIPGTDKMVWVTQANPKGHLKFRVIYERPDGSVVHLSAEDLFGNNTDIPVSKVDITLEQAFAFVTDPSLAVDPGEARNAKAPYPN